MHYYQFNIGDFNNATRHLSRLERGIYRDLIDLYYDSEKPLTNDLTSLCRKVIATTEQERTAVQQVLNEYFAETENGWINDRCQDEIDKYHSNLDAKSAAGKASGEARRAKKHKQPVDNKDNQTGVEQVLNGCSDSFEQNRTKQEPLTNNHKPVTKEKNVVCRFNDFWNVYPVKKGKKKSLEKWKTRKLDDIADMIIEDVVNRARADSGWLDGYIPHPATYINGDCWNDEITVSKRPREKTFEEIQAGLRGGNTYEHKQLD